VNRTERREHERQWKSQLTHRGDKMAVGMISRGEIATEFMESLFGSYEIDQQCGLGRLVTPWRINVHSGANISQARNRVVREFLNLPHQPAWLMLVDADMMWKADAFERLLAAAEPDRIVGGLCFAYGDERLLPTIFEADELMRYKWPAEGYEIPENTLTEVYGTGAAFLLCHRDTLIKIGEPVSKQTNNCWFREVETILELPVPRDTFTHEAYWMSEDLYFCNQAHAAGIGVFVHTGVEVGHKKSHILNRQLYESGQLTWQAHYAKVKEAVA
jgi:hypothetical protein